MRNNSLKKPNPNWRLLLLTAALASYSVGAATPTLTSTDVGFPSYPGSMTTSADGKITVVGGGSDIWGNSDNFHYAYFKVTGDFDYVVKVDRLTGNSDDGGWSKAELMARLEDPSQPGVGPQGGDPHISNMTTRPASDTPPTNPDTGTAGVAGVNHRGPQWRAQRDGASSWTQPNPTYPPNMPDNWMRMERVGDTFYMYTSNDGKVWNMYNPYNPQGWDTKGSWPKGTDSPDSSVFEEAWPSTIMLGLAVTAHFDGATSEAVFSNFGPYTPVPVAITQQPVAKVDAAANSPLTLSVAATGDPVHYEWRKNGTPVGTNGVGATLNIPLAQTTDSGTYTVRVFGGGTQVISSESVVTITVDSTPPTVVEAKPMASPTSVQVTFSEPVTAATANVAANYQLSGGIAVTAAALSADGFRVLLTTAPQALNTQYTLTVANVRDTAGNTVAANTTAAFTSVSLLKGFAFYERWLDGNGDMGNLDQFSEALDDGSARAPDFSGMVNQFGAPWGATDNYNARVRTFFTPPSNGNYVFFVSADDNAALYLSTDENPANKKMIARETGWSNQYQWTAPGSGSAEEKRSDYSSYNEYGNPITLAANRRYLMEVRFNEGGGGDGADVTFIKEGEDDPTNNTDGMKMRGDAISWYESVDTLPPVVVTQPANATITGGGSGTISVTATNPGAASLTYQWKLNGRDIPGATSANYVISNAGPANIGQYSVAVSNGKASVTSGVGKVLVTATNPFLIEAEDFDYDGGKSMPAASVMPYTGGAYAGLNAVVGVDYGSNDGADSPEYRSLDTQNKSMNDNIEAQWGRTRAGAWDMTVNYKLGWADSADWGNYTRTFPDATYEVFAALSNDNTTDNALRAKIDMVTAGGGTENQTLEPIGIFRSNGSGAWGANNLVRLSDNNGNPKTVALSGQKTVRVTMDSGDFDYLLFIPASATPPPGGFSSVRLTGGNLVIAWGSGTLESADAITGPWTPVANAASPASIPTTGTQKFYRLR